VPLPFPSSGPERPFASLAELKHKSPPRRAAGLPPFSPSKRGRFGPRYLTASVGRKLEQLNHPRGVVFNKRQARAVSGNINQCPRDFSGGDKHYAADDSGPIDKYACDSNLGRFGKEEEADESQYAPTRMLNWPMVVRTVAITRSAK